MASTSLKIQSDPEYLAALNFTRSYNPGENIDYDWVLGHVEKEYAALVKISDGLDEKADSLIRYLGVLVAIMSLAFTYDLLNMKTAANPTYLIPSIGFMLLSMACAVKARMPSDYALPLPSQKAFQYADAFSGNIAKASCAAMTGTASVFVNLANQKKAVLIQAAFWLFITSIFFLVGAACFIELFGK